MTTHHFNGRPLTSTTPIDEWRTAKLHRDKHLDPQAPLGCVGEPIAEWLRKHVLDSEHTTAAMLDELQDAIHEARSKLADYIAHEATDRAEMALAEVADRIELEPASEVASEWSLDDPLSELVDAALEHAARECRLADVRMEVDPADL